MSLTTYFCGWRVDHFKGWGGKLPPSFDSSTSLTKGIGFLNAVEGAVAGRGCAWANFNDSSGAQAKLNDFWMGAWFYNVSQTATATPFTAGKPYPAVIFHSSNGKYAICMMVSAGADGTSTDSSNFRIYLTSDYTDQSKYIDTGILINRFATDYKGSDGTVVTVGDSSVIGAANCGVYFHIAGAGTSGGSITVTVRSPSETAYKGSWNGDLSAWFDFTAVSFHSGGPIGGVFADIRPWAVYVTDSNINYSTFAVDTTSTVGSKNDWLGTGSELSIYPVAWGSTNGLYSNEADQTVTFKPSGSFAIDDGYTIGALYTSAALVADSDMTDAQVTGVLYDAATDTTSTSASPQSVSSDGGSPVWSFPSDPISGNSWSVDLVNAYESGVKRTE